MEANVDRLMKSITSFMSEISDDFKIVLVDAIKTLCLKFPAKYPVMMSFLSGALREEGGFKYKKAIVEAMLQIISEVKEAKESGMCAVMSAASLGLGLTRRNSEPPLRYGAVL